LLFVKVKNQGTCELGKGIDIVKIRSSGEELGGISKNYEMTFLL
jgi:hypothetical protein